MPMIAMATLVLVVGLIMILHVLHLIWIRPFIRAAGYRPAFYLLPWAGFDDFFAARSIAREKHVDPWFIRIFGVSQLVLIIVAVAFIGTAVFLDWDFGSNESLDLTADPPRD